jgi:hypothetical protein
METDSDYDKRKIARTFHKLAGGVSRYFTYSSKLVKRKRKDRVDDALRDLRAARRRIVAGSGVAPLHQKRFSIYKSFNADEANWTKLNAVEGLAARLFAIEGSSSCVKVSRRKRRFWPLNAKLTNT